MSDDLDKKIRQITDILGQDSLPENLKGLLSLLTNTGNKQDSPPKTNGLSAAKEEKVERSDLEDNVEMIRKVKKLMDKVKCDNDPRINLLNAIKPFLNKKRQDKLSNCVKMLHLKGLTRLVDEHNKGD